jgi:Zinc knuckle
MVSANTAAEWFCFHCLQVGHWSRQCPTPHINCHNTNCVLPLWHPNYGDHCPVYDPHMSDRDRCQCTLACQMAEAAKRTLTLKPPTPLPLLLPLPGAFPEPQPTSPIQAGCAVNYYQAGSAYHRNWELV